jgi:uncharacterized protein with PIN domain
LNLQPETPATVSPEFRFIADDQIGRLAKYLRLCGFDTIFVDSLTDRNIIDIAVREHRIILSRDKELMSNKKVTRGFRILSEKPVEQLSEVISNYGLRKFFQPFSRCTNCNGLLEIVNEDEIDDKLPQRTREFFSHFMRCSSCGKIYWEGSHYDRMKKFISSL